jgi:hypothetical protein
MEEAGSASEPIWRAALRSLGRAALVFAVLSVFRNLATGMQGAHLAAIADGWC